MTASYNRSMGEQAIRAWRELRTMQLTPHFQYWELWQPARRGFAATPYPAEWLEHRGLPLLDLLETVRAWWGQSITVTSAYRCEAYNKAVGGSPRSQHLDGMAIDFVVARVPAPEVYRTIIDRWRQGALPLLGGLGLYPNANPPFVHVDTRPHKPGRLAQWEIK